MWRICLGLVLLLLVGCQKNQDLPQNWLIYPTYYVLDMAKHPYETGYARQEKYRIQSLKKLVEEDKTFLDGLTLDIIDEIRHSPFNDRIRFIDQDTAYQALDLGLPYGIYLPLQAPPLTLDQDVPGIDSDDMPARVAKFQLIWAIEPQGLLESNDERYNLRLDIYWRVHDKISHRSYRVAFPNYSTQEELVIKYRDEHHTFFGDITIHKEDFRQLSLELIGMALNALN